MSRELITIEDCQEMLAGIDGLSKKIEDVLLLYKPPLNGERYLTGEQVCEILNISKRTLQGYRDNCEMPYISLFGKLLYKESDLLSILENNYVSSVQ